MNETLSLKFNELKTAAAWRGEDLAERSSEWRQALTEEEVAEIKRAVENFEDSSADLKTINPVNFPLPGLGSLLAGWLDEILHGRGFVVLRGLPLSVGRGDKRRLLFSASAVIWEIFARKTLKVICSVTSKTPGVRVATRTPGFIKRANGKPFTPIRAMLSVFSVSEKRGAAVCRQWSARRRFLTKCFARALTCSRFCLSR